MASGYPGGIQISVDDTAYTQGEQTYELEGGGNVSPTTYGAMLLDAVHSPSGPHPFSMSPPPPPGEPPRLLKNKRPHGLFSSDQPHAEPEACSSVEQSVKMDTEVSRARSPLSAASSATSRSSASSSCGSEACDQSVDGSVPVCSTAVSESSPPEDLDSSMTCSQIPVPPQVPEMPPGLPPAQMAPPPPTGPPPDLPMDRAELKRAVEDSANSPIGKRLRSVNSIPDDPEQLPTTADASSKRPSPGCSSDGDSSSCTSDAEESRPAAQSMPAAPSGASEPGLEASYTQSPPSARWVWDRFLQQDRSAASANILEKRMLHAMDSLHFGPEGKK